MLTNCKKVDCGKLAFNRIDCRYVTFSKCSISVVLLNKRNKN